MYDDVRRSRVFISLKIYCILILLVYGRKVAWAYEWVGTNLSDFMSILFYNCLSLPQFGNPIYWHTFFLLLCFRSFSFFCFRSGCKTIRHFSILAEYRVVGFVYHFSFRIFHENLSIIVKRKRTEESCALFYVEMENSNRGLLRAIRIDKSIFEQTRNGRIEVDALIHPQQGGALYNALQELIFFHSVNAVLWALVSSVF